MKVIHYEALTGGGIQREAFSGADAEVDAIYGVYAASGKRGINQEPIVRMTRYLQTVASGAVVWDAEATWPEGAEVVPVP
jgi:hypothetical protein